MLAIVLYCCRVYFLGFACLSVISGEPPPLLLWEWEADRQLGALLLPLLLCEGWGGKKQVGGWVSDGGRKSDGVGCGKREKE